MSVGPGGRVSVGADVHVREFDGSLVILDLARGDYFGVDEVGAKLWEGLARGESPAEVAAAIGPDYDVDPGVLERDLVRLTDELVARGLVTPRR